MQPPTPAAESPAVPWLRRLFRPKFSLRTLLLGMVVFGAGLGLFQRLDRQRQLVARIEAAGGRCGYPERKPHGPFETWLRMWSSRTYWDDVTSVIFIEDTNKVDNNILPHLAELKSLLYLELDDTQVSDAGLSQLAGLRTLKYLYLNNTQVTDTGLRHLAGLKSLGTLVLGNTAVSDVGLRHLTEMKSLEWLSIKNTQISDSGRQQLKTALPDCQIIGP